MRGEAMPAAAHLRAGGLMWRAAWQWLRGLLGR